MFAFLKPTSHPRRRFSASGVENSVSALESRELLSGANAPVEAVLDSAGTQIEADSQVEPQAKATPLNFGGLYHVNGNSSYVLGLSQDGRSITGTLTGGPGMAVMSIKGKISPTSGWLKNIHFKGTYGGSTYRFSFDQTSTVWTNPSLTVNSFTGNVIQKFQGERIVLETITANRVT